MSTTLTESPAARCDWCGRENKDGLIECADCGTRLVSEVPEKPEEPQGKSVGLAVTFALLFGPVGLFYVRAWGTAFVMILIGLPFLLAHKGLIFFAIAGRIICAALAYRFAIGLNKANPGRDASTLLNEAARLENVDRTQAIAAYEEVIRLHPNTSASSEAARNIETLKRQA